MPACCASQLGVCCASQLGVCCACQPGLTSTGGLRRTAARSTPKKSLRDLFWRKQTFDDRWYVWTGPGRTSTSGTSVL